MGASSSHPISSALQELLKSKGLKIQRKTIEKFLDECDTVAPWYAISGNLTVACWEKLGRDLDVAWEQGILKGPALLATMLGFWVRAFLNKGFCSFKEIIKRVSLKPLN